MLENASEEKAEASKRMVEKYFSSSDIWSKQQFLDEVEQNIVSCQWRADLLFASAE